MKAAAAATDRAKAPLVASETIATTTKGPLRILNLIKSSTVSSKNTRKNDDNNGKMNSVAATAAVRVVAGKDNKTGQSHVNKKDKLQEEESTTSLFGRISSKRLSTTSNVVAVADNSKQPMNSVAAVAAVGGVAVVAGKDNKTDQSDNKKGR